VSVKQTATTIVAMIAGEEAATIGTTTAGEEAAAIATMTVTVVIATKQLVYAALSY
jgi:hypothetical protein